MNVSDERNTPIADLMRQYTEEGCDFTDMQWVRATAARYVSTMPDSQVRCLLAALSTAERASDEGAVAWLRKDPDPMGISEERDCTIMKPIADRWIKQGRKVVPLYTHPPQATVRPVREEWTHQKVAEFICIALRHAEYKKGRDPSTQDVMDAFIAMGIPAPNGVVDQENGT